jgi:hypothetical protein
VAALACGVPLPWMPASAMLVLVALGAAMLRPPPWFLPALLGFAIGAREGGGGWVTWVGLAIPTVIVIFALGAVPLAVGAVLVRRPGWHAGLRWALVPAVAAAVLVQARLSW